MGFAKVRSTVVRHLSGPLCSLSFLALAIASAVAVSGCGHSSEQAKTERIVVASLDYPLSGLLFLAEDDGLFKKHGLDVAVTYVPSGKQGIDAVLENKAQITLAAETATTMSILHGKKIVVMGSLGEAVGDFSVFGRIDHGIRKPEDLLGKSIAVELGTGGEYLLDALLADHHIDRSKVTIVPTSADKIAELLYAGKVDAASGWHPFLLQWKQHLGTNGVTFTDPGYYALTWCVVAPQEYVASHGEALARFFRALVEAERHFRAEPDVMRKLLVNRHILSDDVYDRNIFRFDLRFDQSIPINMEGLAKWAMMRGKVPQQRIPNFLKFFEPGPLKAAKPNAVTILY